jgi:hypothetical protein
MKSGRYEHDARAPTAREGGTEKVAHRWMYRWLTACCAFALMSGAANSIAAEKKQKHKPAPKKLERLACMLGTEDKHARIAVELKGGTVDNFAYYSKWKPRTCSVHVSRGDAYSKWQDYGNHTTVTTENGTFLIEHARSEVQFMFRDVDRMFYCGMEGKIRGSLTVRRGKRECVLEGVMDMETDSSPETGRSAAASPQS